MSPRAPLFAACTCLALAVSAPAQEKPGRVNEELSPKTDSVSWYEERDGKMVRGGTFDTLGALIIKVAPDYYQVRWRDRVGWVKRDEVLVGAPRDPYFAQRLQQNPSDGYTWRYMAQAFQRVGRINEALTAIDEAIRLRPNDALAYQVRATILFLGKHDTRGALEAWANAERVDPSNSDTPLLRAGLWLGQQDYAKAMADFNTAIRLAPNDPNCYSLRAHLWRLQGDTDKAVADLDAAIRIWPDFLTAHVNRAKWLLAAADPDGSRAREAVGSARRACELTYWEDVGQLRLLAQACEQSGDEEGARRCRAKVEELRRPDTANLPPLPPPPAALPTPPPAPEGPPPALPETVDRKDKLVGTDVTPKTANVGWYEVRDGKVVRGGPFNDLFGTVIGASPDCFLIHWRGHEGWVRRADVVVGNDRPLYFGARVRDNSSDAYAQRVCADLLLMGKMASSAGPYLDAAVRLAPNDAMVRQSRAMYLASKGDQAGAEQELRAAERIDPSDPRTYTLRAMCVWLAQKEWDKATAECDKAVRMAPNDERVILVRALFWRDKGDAARALADLDTSLRLWPDYLTAHVRRAELLMDSSDRTILNPKEAVVSARRACELTRWEDAAHVKRLARACELAGYNDEAARCRQKAEEIGRESAAQLPPLPAKP